MSRLLQISCNHCPVLLRYGAETNFMPAERTCSECGAEIPSDARQGLCTRCLLSLGLKDEPGTEVPAPVVSTEKPGDRIGLYKLLQKIDEESLFERSWAMTLLDQVMDRLRDEYAASGKRELFAVLQDHLSGAERLVPYAELGAGLGMSEGAVKVAVHRLRHRYGELLRAEIAQTVSGPEEVEEEIRNLITVTAR